MDPAGDDSAVVWSGGLYDAAGDDRTEAGGAYAIHMEGPVPSAGEVQRTSSVTGTYTKVNPYDLLQFTW